MKAFKDILKQYRILIITLMVGGTLSTITYMVTLIIEDTAWFKQEQELIKWYEKKQNTTAVGLRVDEDEKIWYKAADRELYRAIYDEKGRYYYYIDHDGKSKECH